MRRGKRCSGFLGSCAALLLAAGCGSSAFAQPRGDASPQRVVVLDLDGGMPGDRAASAGSLRDRAAVVPDGLRAPPDPVLTAYTELMRAEVLRHIGVFNRCAHGDGGAGEVDGACVCNELCTLTLPLPPGAPGDTLATLALPGRFRLTYTRRSVTRCVLLHGHSEQTGPPEEHLCASPPRPRHRAPR